MFVRIAVTLGGRAEVEQERSGGSRSVVVVEFSYFLAA